jgi:hypothetical protein
VAGRPQKRHDPAHPPTLPPRCATGGPAAHGPTLCPTSAPAVSSVPDLELVTTPHPGGAPVRRRGVFRFGVPQNWSRPSPPDAVDWSNSLFLSVRFRHGGRTASTNTSTTSSSRCGRTHAPHRGGLVRLHPPTEVGPTSSSATTWQRRCRIATPTERLRRSAERRRRVGMHARMALRLRDRSLLDRRRPALGSAAATRCLAPSSILPEAAPAGASHPAPTNVVGHRLRVHAPAVFTPLQTGSWRAPRGGGGGVVVVVVVMVSGSPTVI